VGLFVEARADGARFDEDDVDPKPATYMRSASLSASRACFDPAYAPRDG
jgi:hypothetical protein